MNPSSSQGRLLTFPLISCLLIGCLAAVEGLGADYGRVSGTVKDPHGNPLVGATILLTGPSLPGSAEVVERVITDAHGKFSVAHLEPGWYSIKATAVTRMPSPRSGIRVAAGQTARQDFVLSDIFAPVQFRVPPGVVATWGEDWKWVLRTSASTRPVLRYRETECSKNKTSSSSKCAKKPVPASQRLVGMMPASARNDPMAEDTGLGSVLAYVRPLSDDADVLVAGAMNASGIQGSSVATAFRRNILKGDPQELTLSVHQLNFSEALPLPTSGSVAGLSRAQGVVVSYAYTRRLSDSLQLMTGFEIDYLDSVRGATAARPRAELEYQVTPSTLVAVRYGGARTDKDQTLLERVGELNAFPHVTLNGFRPELEQLNHAEASVQRRLSKTSTVEVAVFRDSFENTAVWGSGASDVVRRFVGNVLPNPVSDGLTLNAGNYGSSGFRSAYSRRLTDHVDAAVMYTVGDALAVNPGVEAGSNLRGVLRTDRSQAVAAKVRARMPVSKTQVIASYEWMPRGRVTSVDPYGEASLGVHPYLDLQLRQPLPNLAFLPAHIEALADFRNLLAQGYVPVLGTGEEPLLLAPAYRSFRGGFSVQF